MKTRTKGIQLYTHETMGIQHFGQTQLLRPVKPQPEPLLTGTPLPVEELAKRIDEQKGRGLSCMHTKGDGIGLVFPDYPHLPGDYVWGRYNYQQRMAIVGGKDYFTQLTTTRSSSQIWLIVKGIRAIQRDSLTLADAQKQGQEPCLTNAGQSSFGYSNFPM